MQPNDYANITIGLEIARCDRCTDDYCNSVRRGEIPSQELDWHAGDCDLCGWSGHDERAVAHGFRVLLCKTVVDHLIICGECAEDIVLNKSMRDNQNLI